MKSLAKLGGAPIMLCTTARDGEGGRRRLPYGDPSVRLSGKVDLSDGNPIPPGMPITVGSELAADSQTWSGHCDSRSGAERQNRTPSERHFTSDKPRWA